MNTSNDSNFIGYVAGSLRGQGTRLEPDPSGADSLYVSGYIPKPEFDAATSIVTNGKITIPEGQQAASDKRKDSAL